MGALLESLFEAPEVAALFDDRAALQGMLDFEAALTRTQARLGLIPASMAAPIVQACQAKKYDLAELGRATALAGNPAIPMVKMLTVAVAAIDARAAGFVHWGATSQDVIDTSLVLRVREAVRLIDQDLRQLIDALARLAEDNRQTLMTGRTLLQHALPVTFGLKAAGWVSAVQRAQDRLLRAAGDACTLQFGGAAGTLASYGENGLEIAEGVAAELALTLPDVPWHGHRDRLCDLAAALGLLVGTLGKIARDITLMMQTEVGEAAEPAAEGKGGSSAMPHKRNPVGCTVALSAAIRVPPLVATMFAAMPQEHERGLGGWHAEWETLPAIFRAASGAVRQMLDVCGGLEIDVRRMRLNLDMTGGLVSAEAVTIALAERIGRTDAYRIVEEASREALRQDRTLAEVLGQCDDVAAHLTPEDLRRLCDPATQLGMADALITRALAGLKKEA